MRGWRTVVAAGMLLCLGACIGSGTPEGRTYHPPFPDAESRTALVPEEPASGEAVSDPVSGVLTCEARAARDSGERQEARAELQLDDAVFLTRPRTIAFSALVSAVWDLKVGRRFDVAGAWFELRLENLTDPADVQTLVLVRKVLTAADTVGEHKALLTFSAERPLQGQKRYRLTAVVRAAVLAQSADVPRRDDLWRELGGEAADLVPERTGPRPTPVPDGGAQARLVGTLHWVKWR
jgi:hypothetical protein